MTERQSRFFQSGSKKKGEDVINKVLARGITKAPVAKEPITSRIQRKGSQIPSDGTVAYRFNALKSIIAGGGSRVSDQQQLAAERAIKVQPAFNKKKTASAIELEKKYRAYKREQEEIIEQSPFDLPIENPFMEAFSRQKAQDRLEQAEAIRVAEARGGGFIDLSALSEPASDEPAFVYEAPILSEDFGLARQSRQINNQNLQSIEEQKEEEGNGFIFYPEENQQPPIVFQQPNIQMAIPGGLGGGLGPGLNLAPVNPESLRIPADGAPEVLDIDFQRPRAARRNRLGVLEFFPNRNPVPIYGYEAETGQGTFSLRGIPAGQGLAPGTDIRNRYKSKYADSGAQRVATRKDGIKHKFSSALPDFVKELNSTYKFLIDSGIDNDFRAYGKNFFIGTSLDPISKKNLQGFKEGIGARIARELNRGDYTLATVAHAHYKTAVMLKKLKDFRSALASLRKTARAINKPSQSNVAAMLNFSAAALNPKPAMTAVGQGVLDDAAVRDASRKGIIRQKLAGPAADTVIKDWTLRRNIKRGAAREKIAAHYGVEARDLDKWRAANQKSAAYNLKQQGLSMGLEPSMTDWNTTAVFNNYGNRLVGTDLGWRAGTDLAGVKMVRRARPVKGTADYTRAAAERRAEREAYEEMVKGFVTGVGYAGGPGGAMEVENGMGADQ